MRDREIKKIKKLLCCILKKLPSLEGLVFFSNEGTNDLSPLAVPGILGKLYIDIDTGEQWMANPSGESPYYIRVGSDVIEVASYVALPATGETGKIYITIDNNNQYRWSGSVYVLINDPSESVTFDFMGGLLTNSISPYYPSFSIKINTITNVKNAPTTTITKNGSPYILGSNILMGDTVVVAVSTASVVRLNYTKL